MGVERSFFLRGTKSEPKYILKIHCINALFTIPDDVFAKADARIWKKREKKNESRKKKLIINN